MTQDAPVFIKMRSRRGFDLDLKVQATARTNIAVKKHLVEITK